MSIATATIDKVVNPGRVDAGRHPVDVFCRVQYDGSRLSISGVEGPKRNGDAAGSCGQINMGYAHRDPADNDPRYSSPSRLVAYTAGWDEGLWFDFLDVWKRWHLNDMRAECEHQRELGWTYSTHEGQECPECGYLIGSAWLHEDVPDSILELLERLPHSHKVPEWV